MMTSQRLLDFHEALKDSPRFREHLREHENYFMQLEKNLKNVIRLCATMTEFGKSYVAAFFNMVEAMKELNSECFASDPAMCSAFGIVAMAYEEIVNLHKLVVEQAYWSLSKRLNEFIARELHKTQDMRAHFERASNSLDEALQRNAAAPAHNKSQQPNERSDVYNELVATGTCFAHQTLDLVFHMNLLHAKDAPEILAAFTSFLHVHRTQLTKGKQMFDEWSRDEQYVQDSAQQMLTQVTLAERTMHDRHLLVPKDVFQTTGGMSPDADVVMEGYLFKRSSNAFKTWNRRWFIVRDNQLLYRSRDTHHPVAADKVALSTQDGYSVMEAQLHLCLVRPAAAASVERANCFELVTPNKIHLLQTDSEALLRSWTKALQRTIESALLDESPVINSDRTMSDSLATKNGTSHSRQPSDHTTARLNASAKASPEMRSSPRDMRVPAELFSVLGNEECADCGSARPVWASINLGVLLCIECCSVHRSLGVQVSKVRSVKLDAWDAEHVRLLEGLGNQAVNTVYMAHLPTQPMPPQAKPTSTRAQREAWIRAKYVERRFVHAPVEHAMQVALLHSHTRRKPSRHVTANTHRHTHYAAKRANSVGVLAGAQDMSAAQTVPAPAALSSASAQCVTVNHRISSCGSATALDTLQNADEGTGDANQALLAACKAGDVQSMMAAVAQGADVNCKAALPDSGLNNAQHKHMDMALSHVHFTPLHQAVLSKSAPCVEYLLLNGAKVNVADSHMQTPLHMACSTGTAGVVCQLMKRAAMQDVRNTDGHTPLDIAVQGEHADIVTLLRLSKLRDEFVACEPMNNSMDQHMDSLLKDIGHKSYTNTNTNTNT